MRPLAGTRGVGMSRDARRRLAAAQAAVVRALVAEGEVPAGFDEHHVDNARRVIADKQARMATRRARARRGKDASGKDAIGKDQASAPRASWWRRLMTRRSAR